MRSLQMLAETGILTTRLTIVHRDVVAVDVGEGEIAEDKGEHSHVDGQMHKYVLSFIIGPCTPASNAFFFRLPRKTAVHKPNLRRPLCNMFCVDRSFNRGCTYVTRRKEDPTGRTLTLLLLDAEFLSKTFIAVPPINCYIIYNYKLELLQKI